MSETMQARKEWREMFKVSKKIHTEEFQIIYVDILKEERYNFLLLEYWLFMVTISKEHIWKERGMI